jgi:hypothetical protein
MPLTPQRSGTHPPRAREADTRYWSCKTDKSGNGYAIIRFLPTPSVDGEDSTPFVRLWTHGFKGPTGKWYIENCLSTLGQPDPVLEVTNALWDSKVQANIDIARPMKRQLGFHSNVYVVRDPANPENEGKVFLFRYGKKLFDKITEYVNPQFPDDPRIDPFDLWNGSNFKLKIRKVDGYTNYDQSSFETPAPLFNDDDKLEAIWKKAHSLKEIIDPKQFKSYDQLKAHLDLVLGNGGSNPAAAQRMMEEEREAPAPSFKQKPAPAASTEDEDDDFAFFNSLSDD